MTKQIDTVQKVQYSTFGTDYDQEYYGYTNQSVAQQIRLRWWAEQICDCQNCSEGMDVENWCIQNNLTKSHCYCKR